MRRLFIINTPYEQSPYIYANAEFSSAEGSEEDVWDDEKDSDWNGCCEDPYEDDEEENEREWCD